MPGRRHLTAVLRNPTVWTALSAVALTAIAVYVYLHGEIQRPLLISVIAALGVGVALTGQATQRRRAVAAITAALAAQEARTRRERQALLTRVGSVETEIAALLGAVGPDAIDRRINALTTQVNHLATQVNTLATETNALGYQAQSLPSALHTHIDAERTDAYMAALTAQAREAGLADTTVIHMPPQWRRGA